MEQLAARRAHNPKVGGSSPPPATKADNSAELSVFFVQRKNGRAVRFSEEVRAVRCLLLRVRRAFCSDRGVTINLEAMKEKENTTCDPCERNFERNIDRIVKAGEAPAEKTRREKEAEVKSAFAEEHPAAM